MIYGEVAFIINAKIFRSLSMNFAVFVWVSALLAPDDVGKYTAYLTLDNGSLDRPEVND